MRVIIAGGREFDDYDLLCSEMVDLNLDMTTLSIVSGTARGADSLGERWAYNNNIPVNKFPALWRVHGKSAGYRRNAEMADNADMLVAFWDGKSKGTRHMIDLANRKGLAVLIIHY